MENSRYNGDIKDRMPMLSARQNISEQGYLVCGFLGEGAFSQVYKVQEKATGRMLACKEVRQKNIWEREIMFLPKACHPLFPAYFGHWQSGGRYYLLMELVSGENLDVLIRRRGRLSQRQAIQIGIALAEGLAFLEGQTDPIVFRDLKPENIRIREDGRVKLLDFGCACLAGEEMSQIAGTPGYAAPEQFVKGNRGRPCGDVYAFGRLFHYMLTGDEPCLFPANKPGIRFYGKGYGRGLEQLIGDCVCEEASKRLPDMRRVLRRLIFFARRPVRVRAAEIFDAVRKKRGPQRYIYLKNVLKSSHI